MEYSESQLNVIKRYTNDPSSVKRIHASEFHQDDDPINPFNPFDWFELWMKSFGMVKRNSKYKDVTDFQAKYHVIFLFDDPNHLHLIPKKPSRQ